MRLLRHTVYWLFVYCASWVTAYSAMMLSRGDGLDFSHVGEYFLLAWTFQGGELVSFIWVFSVAVFLLMAGLTIFVLRRCRRSSGRKT